MAVDKLSLPIISEFFDQDQLGRRSRLITFASHPAREHPGPQPLIGNDMNDSLTGVLCGGCVTPMELVCPAGSLPALKTAIDNGADCVYMGFRDDTNARNFTGLNFDPPRMREGVRYAHARGRKVLLALNTYPQAGNWPSLDSARSTTPPKSASTP